MKVQQFVLIFPSPPCLSICDAYVLLFSSGFCQETWRHSLFVFCLSSLFFIHYSKSKERRKQIDRSRQRMHRQHASIFAQTARHIVCTNSMLHRLHRQHVTFAQTLCNNVCTDSKPHRWHRQHTLTFADTACDMFAQTVCDNVCTDSTLQF